VLRDGCQVHVERLRIAAAPGHVEEVQRLVFHGLSGTQVAQLADICESIVHATRPGHCLPNA